MEEWKDMVQFPEFYQISSFGRIMSKNRLIKGRNCEKFYKAKVLKTKINVFGYVTMTLTVNKKVLGFSLHRLVAEAFIENPESKRCVNHKDANKQNNNISNLEWATQSENIKHAYANKLYDPRKKRHHKLTESDVRCIRLSNEDTKELAKIYSVSCSTIIKVKARETWRNVS